MGRARHRRSLGQSQPGPTRVVRVNSPQWSEKHSEILQQLIELVQNVIRSCDGMAFEEIKRTCEQNDPRLQVGDDFAYILYGPNEIFLQDGQLKLDIRGLIYKPIIRMEGDRIIVEVGSDGVLESA